MRGAFKVEKRPPCTACGKTMTPFDLVSGDTVVPEYTKTPA